MPLVRAELKRKHHQLRNVLKHDISQVLYLPFDYDDGNYARDRSGYNNHGTIHGATRVTGKIGDALNFDGVDDDVNLGDVNAVEGLSAETITAWFKVNAFSGVPDCHAEITSKDYNHLRIFVRQDNHKLYFLETAGGDTKVMGGETSINVGQWYFVAAVYDGSYMRLYLNGALDATPVAATGTTLNNAKDLLVGKYSSTSLINGTIDEVRIFNRALSQAEIQRIMNMRGL